MIKWINIAKGIGIIAIVVGHSNVSQMAYNYLYYFHIPLFFFISGYLNNKSITSIEYGIPRLVGYKREFNYIKLKFNAYMLPYYSYGLIFTILLFFLHFLKGTLNSSIISVSTKGYLFGQVDFMANSNLWFLPALFFTVIFGYYAIKYFNLKYSLRNNLFWILALILAIHLFNGKENYFMSLTTIPAALLFYTWGVNYKSLEVLDKMNSLLFTIGLAVFTLCSYFYSFHYLDQAIDIGNTRIRPSIFFMIINAFLGILLVIKISKILKSNRLLEFIGRYSLYIFLFHQIFVPIISLIYNISFLTENWILTSVMKIAFSLLLYFFIIKFLKTTKIGNAIF